MIFKCTLWNENQHGGQRKCFGYDKYKVTKVLSIHCFRHWMKVQPCVTASHVKNPGCCLATAPIHIKVNATLPNLHNKLKIYFMREKKKKEKTLLAAHKISNKNQCILPLQILPNFLLLLEALRFYQYFLLCFLAPTTSISFLSDMVFSVSNVAWNVGHVTCRVPQSDASSFSAKWRLINESRHPEAVSSPQRGSDCSVYMPTALSKQPRCQWTELPWDVGSLPCSGDMLDKFVFPGILFPQL